MEEKTHLGKDKEVVTVQVHGMSGGEFVIQDDAD